MHTFYMLRRSVPLLDRQSCAMEWEAHDEEKEVDRVPRA